MNGTIDDRYLEWLYSQIASVRNRNPERSYWSLAKKLYTIPFEWFVPNDDNRAADGCDLRFEFIDEYGPDDVPPVWMGLQCSMLEMFIGLARRVSFESYGTPGEWFWQFMENLELKEYTDDIYEVAIDEEVAEVMNRVINREYDRDGRGGIFPIVHDGHKDQRKVELAYQMSAYLLEGKRIDNGPPRQ